VNPLSLYLSAASEVIFGMDFPNDNTRFLIRSSSSHFFINPTPHHAGGHHNQSFSMNCIFCQNLNGTLVSRTDCKSNLPLDVYLCDSCGLIQQSPIPTAEELHRYYSTEYRLDYKRTIQPKPKHVLRSVRSAINRLDYLSAAGIRSGRLLDIGAGSGEFVALANRAGFEAEGVEPNEGYSDYARREYGSPVRTAHLDELDGTYDVITMFHVLEHLLSPLEVFAKLRRHLRPGGALFIEVPWALSNSISPNNRYFKAHLHYFDVETLAASASQQFDAVAASTKGNLRMIFRPKSEPCHLTLPSAAYVVSVRKQLRRHTWFNYLIAGRGLLKPVRIIRRLFEERRLRGKTGRSILESALPHVEQTHRFPTASAARTQALTS
jgi:2-polyprenyl-3-methyl-5-hydroxy-6-metoxy-1,4-benzoquinol methylase